MLVHLVLGSVVCLGVLVLGVLLVRKLESTHSVILKAVNSVVEKAADKIDSSSSSS